MAQAISGAELQYQKALRSRQKDWERYVSQTNPSYETPAYDEYLASQGGIEAARKFQQDWNRQNIFQQEIDLRRQALEDERKAAAFQGKLSTAAVGGYFAKEMGWLKGAGLEPAIKTPPKDIAAAYNAGAPGATTLAGTTPPAAIPEVTTAGIPTTNVPAYSAGATPTMPTLPVGEGATIASTTPAATTLAPSVAGPAEISAADWSASMAAEMGYEGAGAGAGMGLGTASLGVGASIFLGATIGSMFGKGKGQQLATAFGAGIAGALALTSTAAGASVGAALGIAGAALGPVGFVVGAGLGIVLGGGSIVCTELYRQGYITRRQRQLCEIYRRKYADDELYEGYLVWGGRAVSWLEAGGWKKRLVLPLAMLFTEQMINVVRGRRGSWKHRLVGFAAYRLSRLMYALRKHAAMEVA